MYSVFHLFKWPPQPPKSLANGPGLEHFDGMPNKKRKQQKVTVRGLELRDYEDLLEAMKLAYEEIDVGPWSRPHIAALLKKFPHGQIVVVVNGKVVGCALSLIVDYAILVTDTITTTSPPATLFTPTPRAAMSCTASTFSFTPSFAACDWLGASTMSARNCVKSTTCAPSSPAAAFPATRSTRTTFRPGNTSTKSG